MPVGAPLPGTKVAVYVVFDAGVTISCVWAPPSDQDWKTYEVDPDVWGEGAPSVRRTPTTPCAAKGVVTGWPSSVTCRPVGFAARLSVTTRGTRSTDVVLASP